MRYKPLPSDFYKKNRINFVDSMLSKSIAVFNSNDIYPISADSTYFPFQQHRDIFYLTGIEQEETILLIFPDAKKIKEKEILFIKETDEKISIWEGEKLSLEKARDSSGIETVLWLSDFEKVFNSLANKCEKLYINTNEHYRAKVETQTREDRFINWAKKKYPYLKHVKGNLILQRLRSIKTNEEINQIQKACDITEKGFKRILNFVTPGVYEYEIEAEFSHEFLKNSSLGFAYQPIIASGKNNNVLHYVKNNGVCKSGDLVLIDVGAEYGNYSSDMTRTIPISGKFSKRQRKVYNAVLKVKIEATKLLSPGTLWKEYHHEVGKIMSSELISLGLLTKSEVKNQNPKDPAYKKYFMHGTSHHLGLDTHDYGLIDEPMKKNMVFTVEPGIYLPKEGFGIRLEDDVVIKEKGKVENLMKNIPIDPNEIEELMSKN
jgi:Xaa-Pro aminopeptidase